MRPKSPMRILVIPGSEGSFVFHPRHNGQWPLTSKDFLSQILSITFIFLSLFLRKSQYFPIFRSVLNKGTTSTIFITSYRPWLGIEPGTSCTRSQHYTTRLSRRRCFTIQLVMISVLTSKRRTLHVTYQTFHQCQVFYEELILFWK